MAAALQAWLKHETIVRTAELGAVAAEGRIGRRRHVAELEVLSVAETSSVTEIRSPKRPMKVGDLRIFPPPTSRPWWKRTHSAPLANIPPYQFHRERYSRR